jgi:hypothetical protein
VLCATELCKRVREEMAIQFGSWNSRPAILNESRRRKWEAEESPLIEAVARERHVKIQQAGKA